MFTKIFKSSTAQCNTSHMPLLAWRELGELTDKEMVEDLLSNQKAESPIGQYVRFKLSDNNLPDNMNEEKRIT